MAATAAVGAAIGYGAQVYSNYQNGYTGSDAWTENISPTPIVGGAIVGTTSAVAAPVVLAEMGTVLAGTGAALGSTTIFGAGLSTLGAANTLTNFYYDGALSTSKFLTDVASRAESRIGGTGPVVGTLKHAYSERLINRYQGMYGPVGDGLSTEVRYATNAVPGAVRYGTPGSVRLDVVEGSLTNPTAVYDLKFGNALFSSSRINHIRFVGNFSASTPILEIRPR